MNEIDIAKDFENFFNNEHRAIATISSDYGGGRYEAETIAGAKLIINGTANVGDKIFYDVRELRILEKTPDVDFLSGIPV